MVTTWPLHCLPKYYFRSFRYFQFRNRQYSTFHYKCILSIELIKYSPHFSPRTRVTRVRSFCLFVSSSWSERQPNGVCIVVLSSELGGRSGFTLRLNADRRVICVLAIQLVRVLELSVTPLCMCARKNPCLQPELTAIVRWFGEWIIYRTRIWLSDVNGGRLNLQKTNFRWIHCAYRRPFRLLLASVCTSWLIITPTSSSSLARMTCRLVIITRFGKFRSSRTFSESLYIVASHHPIHPVCLLNSDGSRWYFPFWFFFWFDIYHFLFFIWRSYFQ